MSHDAVNNWVEKAKSLENAIATEGGVQVVRRVKAQSRGNAIMRHRRENPPLARY